MKPLRGVNLSFIIIEKQNNRSDHQQTPKFDFETYTSFEWQIQGLSLCSSGSL